MHSKVGKLSVSPECDCTKLVCVFDQTNQTAFLFDAIHRTYCINECKLFVGEKNVDKMYNIFINVFKAELNYIELSLEHPTRPVNG